ncbi:MAG: nitrate reductase [Planctomycetota bacterium]
MLPSSDEQKRTGTRVGRAVCPYCGVGCVLDATVANNRVEKIAAVADAPNQGMMCPKGALLSRVFNDEQRLTQPMIRLDKSDPLRSCSWDEAIGFIADRFSETLERKGPDALAWYGSGQLDSEASYVFSKLFKGFLGSNHTDTNSRLCMSSAVAGYTLALGSDGPPTCYDDIEEAETFLILGANMAVNHPVLFNRVRRRRTDSDRVRIITVDPRFTKTAEHGDLHAPVVPGGDVALLQWLAKRLLETGRINEEFVAAHTSGWEEHRAYLERCDARELAMLSGVPDATLETMADWIGSGRRLLTFYCMGANQSSVGTDKNLAILNMHLMLGQIGMPGCGPFSLTGQPNAMGGREVGYLGHQLPGYRKVVDTADRTEIEAAWALTPGSIASEPGLTAVPMFEAAADGRFDALWIACTNPIVSLPDATTAKRALETTPLVIVQDITARSETASYADVLLPACQWGEKSGTMTNSERLVVRSEKFLDPPGEAKQDWWMPAAVGRAMGFPGFSFSSSEDVWAEYTPLTAGRPCDCSGMTNARLEQSPLRWPCVDEQDPGAERRYTHGRFDTPDGKARFHTGSLAGPAEMPDEAYPLWLTTGRVAAHWHTRTKSALSPELARQEPCPFVEVHPDDAEALGLVKGDFVEVRSRRGQAEAVVRVTDRTRPGVVFATFHFGASFANGVNLNDTTNPATCPKSKQPELKACAVRLDSCVTKPVWAIEDLEGVA